jgi:hypothetical protein
LVEHLPLVASAPLLIDDPLQVITDPASWVAGWLWPAIFGQDAVGQPDWVGGLFARAFFFTGLDASQCTAGSGGGNCSSFSIWSALQTTGYLVLAMALMFRMVRNMLDPDKRDGVAKWLVFDVIVRGALGVAAINVSYAVLAMLMHSSIVVGGALFQDIMSVTTGGGGGEAGLRSAVSGILSPANLPVPLILETLVVIYLTALLLASRVAMIFAIAVAPLVLPIYAYSGQSSVILWWLRLVGQGLLVPVVMGALFAVALIVIQAVNGLQGGAMATLLGTVTAVVSLWFVGHSIHNLLRFLFPRHETLMGAAVVLQTRAGFVRNRIGAALAPAAGIVRTPK